MKRMMKEEGRRKRLHSGAFILFIFKAAGKKKKYETRTRMYICSRGEHLSARPTS